MIRLETSRVVWRTSRRSAGLARKRLSLVVGKFMACSIALTKARSRDQFVFRPGAGLGRERLR